MAVKITLPECAILGDIKKGINVMKTLLVCLAHLNRVDDVIEAAAALARSHNSHVIGLFPIPGPTLVHVGHPGGYMPTDNRVQELYEEKADEIRTRFEARMQRDQLNFEWRIARSILADVSDVVVEHGREADLVIVSKDDSKSGNITPNIHFIADIIMGAGRPVLIIPPNEGKTPVFKKMVVGWNASREACRAAFDSMPIAKSADEVLLTWVNPEKSLGQDGKLPGAELAAAFARNDVKVTTKGLSNRSKPGVALLTYAREQNADLLAMGAYGHSRIRERILGGATEYVLRHMDLPVLMSN